MTTLADETNENELSSSSQSLLMNDNGDENDNTIVSNENYKYGEEEEDMAIVEMERLLAQQDEEDRNDDNHNDNGDENSVTNFTNDNNDNRLNNQGGEEEEEEEDQNQIPADPRLPPQNTNHVNNYTKSKSFFKTNYTKLSLLVTTIHILYILRTRKQIYLSLMYLTTSRLSYILIANSILSTLISIYHSIIKFFLNGGLRFIESETISDSIRWNITESIFVLTMFRSEVNVKLMSVFVIIFWGKCLHWAMDLRGSHLRMTQEVFYFLDDNESENEGGGSDYDNSLNVMSFARNISTHTQQHDSSHNNPASSSPSSSMPMTFKLLSYILPTHTFTAIQTSIHSSLPRIHSQHFYYWIFMNILYTFDIILIAYCSNELLETGPSAHILFLFESTIMLISVLSCHCLYMVHVLDGLVNVVQRLSCGSDNGNDDGDDIGSGEIQETVEPVEGNEDNSNESSSSSSPPIVTTATATSRHKILIGRLASKWKDSRATANFTIELLSLSAKFLLHLILFIAVFSTYGLPISIIRDFYMAHLKLRNRLSAFVSYRKLTSNMESRFQTITNDADLENVGHTCIICRDLMDVHGIHGICKKLPMCGHAFHKHCLREWLVQQHSCPTCRADIQANEARAVTHEVVAEEDLDGDGGEDNNDSNNNSDYNDNGVDNNTVEDSTSEKHQSCNNCKTEECSHTNYIDNGDHCKEYNDKSIMEYPILYKVTKSVPVAQFSGHNNGSSSVGHDLIVKRVIQAGTLVLCTDMKLWVWRDLKIECDDFDNKLLIENECLPAQIGTGMFLKIPDGSWIRQNELMKVLELKK
jgi:hypothetical protein